ncbi:gamma-glutamylcyclotransferase family protein [Streptomyces beijiangensis]|uniref:Gamma-glutamylcyclotransferase n=1 Tax=Streptomyces beijiangensis TaxID=163361 RepID=A0A939FE46_9ACTN|nr:gamma-glutamylcyclotransferase family protein [Streptomyces beijiangensis]MBO0517641.1 gamma-glutamylcyclotransferase [Streptomyces beijiangensis]
MTRIESAADGGDEGLMPEQELPFFVYGTLRPGERNHDLFLRGRTASEEPASLPGLVLYQGPGYPYAIEAPGTSVGELVTAGPGAYPRLLDELDRLEDEYDRVARDVLRADGTPVRAWVYVITGAEARRLRSGGHPIPGGDWRD